ncbi:MAG: HAD family phosphatase [Sedimentisphaerales bacterium]|nr:HAD family phosphatase [Sedimentisphaerales bacterium]
MIKAVIFDLGRVLIDLDFAPLLHRLFNDSSNEDAFERFERMRQDEIAQQYGRGQIDPHQFHAALCRKYNLTIDFQDFTQLWCDVFTPKPDMLALLQDLQGRLPVGLLSDTDPLHWHYITENYPAIAAIPRPTLSYQIGALKPDPHTYRTAAKNVGTPIPNCLFIDDLPANVQGARQVGMQAVCLQSAQQIRDLLRTANIPNVSPRT